MKITSFASSASLALFAATALSAASSASAHVTLQEPLAGAGTAYRAVLQVGHGCDGAATTGITATIPAGFNGAQPLVKPGWTLKTVVGKLAEPYTMHGKTITEGVQQISWTAKGAENALPNAFGDEFVFRVTTNAHPGKYWFKVLQNCTQGSVSWSEIPADGQSAHDLKSPAAALELIDVGAGAGEHHH